MHVALLGDSIFDNQAYTDGQPDVVHHFRDLAPPGWRATLLAIDGSTIADLPRQLGRVPRDATHLVISIGGNDALANADVLSTRVSSTTEALTMLADRVERFEAAYRASIGAALASGREVVLCTIYNGDLDPAEARPARVALTAFNDVILRTAFEHRLAAIELRLVCTERSDYANPIEPSGPGGRKIAAAIRDAVDPDRRVPHARVYSRPEVEPA